MGFILAIFLAAFGSLGDASASEPVCYRDAHTPLPINNDEILFLKNHGVRDAQTQAHVLGVITKVYLQPRRRYFLFLHNREGHAEFRLQIGPGPDDSIRLMYNLEHGALPRLRVGMVAEACGGYENSRTEVLTHARHRLRLKRPYTEGGFMHDLHRKPETDDDTFIEGYEPWRSGYLKIDGVIYNDCDLYDCSQMQIHDIPYPAGESFVDVARTLVIPYFDKMLAQPLPLKNISFSLRNLLSAEENDDMDNAFEHPEQYDGAVADFNRGKLSLTNGGQQPLYRTNLMAAALSYDMQLGLVFSIPGVRNKIYLLPMSGTNLREYTTHTDHKIHDMSYIQLWESVQHTPNPYVYAAEADIAIGGRLQALKGLSPDEQSLVLDVAGIAIAEYYEETKTFSYYRPGELARVGPVYNMLLYGPRLLQITNFSDNPELSAPDSAYFNNHYHERMKLADLNGDVITHVSRLLHPYEYADLTARVPAPASNIFELLTFLAGHSRYYDDSVALDVRKILLALPNERLLINRDLKAYVMQNSSLVRSRNYWLNLYRY